MKLTRCDLEELLDGLGMDREDPIKEKYGWTGGATCLGIVFDFFSQWEELLVELTVLATENEAAGNHLAFRVEHIKQMIKQAKRADVGHGIIIYWPYGGLEIVD